MTKQKGNPKFSFLFGGEYFYHYYTYKVNAEQASLQRDGDEWEATDRTNPSALNESDFDNSGSIREKLRSSRWDAAADPSIASTIPPTGPPGLWDDGSMYQPPGIDKIAISNCSKLEIFKYVNLLN